MRPSALGSVAPADIRRRLLAWRAALAPAEAAARSARITDHVLAWPAFRSSRAVALYVATSREVQTGALIAAAHAAGMRVSLPAVFGDALDLRVMTPGMRLRRGPLNVAEPPEDAELQDPGTVDLILVPGVAFDPAGHRVGRGGGHYDRLLPRLSPRAVTCGLAFREQLVPAIAARPWDARVGHLCDEDGVRTCRDQA